MSSPPSPPPAAAAAAPPPTSSAVLPDGKLNADLIQKSVQNDVMQEEKYRAEDAMKKRAIHSSEFSSLLCLFERFQDVWTMSGGYPSSAVDDMVMLKILCPSLSSLLIIIITFVLRRLLIAGAVTTL